MNTMMAWVLVLTMHNGNYLTTTQVPVETKALCEQAKKDVLKQYGSGWAVAVYPACVQVAD